MDAYADPEESMRADGAQFYEYVPPRISDLLSADYWLTRKLEPPEPLLGEIITNTTRMFIGGPTGLGKTHLGMAMAAAMAAGEDFLHWKASRPCRVLYIDGEMARDLVQERLADLQRRMDGADLSRFFVLCTEDCEDLAKRFPALGSFAPLNTEEGQTFLLRLIGMLGGVDAVFFDNRMSLLCGDMKEEQPWTDTMPLVKELTRRRVAQIWLDHTGHNTGQLYGTKTKEWQFDAVALMSKVERPGLDIAFSLEFTKARRRKPSNRADFETVTFAMVKDAWTADVSPDGVRSDKSLTPIERGCLKELNDMFAEPDAAVAKNVPGSPGDASGPSVLTLTQEQVRRGFVRRGRLDANPDGTLTSAARTKLYTVLNSLKDKGKIGRMDGLIWLL